MSQKKMTAKNTIDEQNDCPAEGLLKMLSGKWKAQIFRQALHGPIRFNALLRQLEGSNKQSIAVALKELEQQDILERKIINLKPLHVEYSLSVKGESFIPVFRQLESLT